MGYALGGIPSYSSDYDTADRSVYSSRLHFCHKVGKLYYGPRYQCVEFARRWLIHVAGITFSEVGMAYEIFDMPHTIRVKDKEKIPWTNIPNGSVPGGGAHRSYSNRDVEVSDEWVTRT